VIRVRRSGRGEEIREGWGDQGQVRRSGRGGEISEGWEIRVGRSGRGVKIR